jgi:hypothetical protein
MKNADEQANAWLFKVVIFFIVTGFLLSLIPLAKAQGTDEGREPFRTALHAVDASLLVDHRQITLASPEWKVR